MAATWSALGDRSVRSVQAKTEAAPSKSGDGLLLDHVAAVTFWLDAGQGQTITADTGQVDVYAYDVGSWGAAPLLVLQVPTGSSGRQRVSIGTVEILNPRGRIAPIANTVPASGATVTIDALVTARMDGVVAA